MVTTVVHCKRDKYDVLVDRTTKWGNPFPITPAENRAAVIEKYKQYIMKKPQLLEALPELKDKVLGCWCHPKACHGDVLAKLAHTYKSTQITR